MKLKDLPAQYVPYVRVKIGTNRLENVKCLLSVNGFIPLLFGQGSPPKIWLSVPANKEGTEWYPLIKENFSSHRDIRVETALKRVTIKAPQGTILNVLKSDDGSLVVLKLDLRAFGLDVYTDAGALIVMGSRLSNNQFNNVQTVIAVGDGGQAAASAL